MERVMVPVITDSIFETNLTFPITTQYVLIHRRMHSIYNITYTYLHVQAHSNLVCCSESYNLDLEYDGLHTHTQTHTI